MRMSSYIVAYAVFIMLFNGIDSRFARTHGMHRRNRQIFQASPGMSYGNQTQPAPFPPYNPAYLNPGQTPPVNNEFSSENVPLIFPPTIPFTNPVKSYAPLSYNYFEKLNDQQTEKPAANAESSFIYTGLPSVSKRLVSKHKKSNADSSFNANRNKLQSSLKRKRKTVAETNGRLEKIKRTSLGGSVRRNVLNKKDYLKHFKQYFRSDVTGKSTTLIPIPEGLQIKSVSKQDNGKVNSTVNITSGTQKSPFGNTTEIENVVEMQMEKKIEDDKGANQGSEEVRIVETEHVKPIINKKWNGLNFRKRKSYSKRFIAHHRNKRCIRETTDRPRLNSVFNKMARRFFTAVRRNERVLQGRQMTPNFKKRGTLSRSLIPNTKRNAGEETMYDRDELNDFVKFFLKQMQKFKKSYKDIKGLNRNKYWDISTPSAHKIKKINRNFQHSEHMNFFMNLNMTLDIKLNEQSSKYSRKTRENYSFAPIGLTTTTTSTVAPSTAFTTEQTILTLVHGGERKDSRVLDAALFFFLVPFLLVLPVWGIGRKLSKIIRLNNMISKAKSYENYHECKSDKLKGLRYARIKNVCTEDYPQLEWQSEDGNWLSDKEIDVKGFS